jgi:WD40 repeat protein
MRVLEAGTGAEVLCLRDLDRRIFCAAFTSDGSEMLVGGTGPIHRLSLPDGERHSSLDGHQHAVASLLVSPDGRFLSSTGADGTVRLWSTVDWSEACRAPIGAGGVYQQAFMPSGEAIAVSADRMIVIFAVPDLHVVQHVAVPVKGVYGVSISPDGRYLANAAADGMVRVWTIR